jgi:zinc transport system substrate-binding protein
VRTRIILIILGIVAVVSGCGGSAGTAGDGDGSRLSVVAGFYPLAYAAERIGGERVSVRNLTPPGAEPHDLELSPRDVEAVRAADVVLYLGEGFQPGLEDAIEGASGQAVDLLDGLDLREGGSAEEGEEQALDPHVWLDPLLYAAIAERIGAALGRPEQAGALVDELQALDQEFRAGLADCERRSLVTSHAAFGYLAARYGLEQIAITGLTPEAEPSPRDLERVVDIVRESGATTVFFERLVAPDLAETVARETGATTAVLDPLEGLTSDEVSAGADYFTVMRENLAALREALGCR